MSCIVKESCHKVNIKVFKVLDYQRKEFSEKKFRTGIMDFRLEDYYILYNNKYLFLLNIRRLPKKYLSLKTILLLERSPAIQINSISLWYQGEFHSSYTLETNYIRILGHNCEKLIKFSYNFLLIHEYDLCVSKN